MEKRVERLKEKLWDFVEKYDFAHGNAEVLALGADTDIQMTIESPRHTTLTVYFKRGDFSELEKNFRHHVVKKVTGGIADFDVDDAFNELWSYGFGVHNGFSPREFIAILESDAAHFKRQLAVILKEEV